MKKTNAGKRKPKIIPNFIQVLLFSTFQSVNFRGNFSTVLWLYASYFCLKSTSFFKVLKSGPFIAVRKGTSMDAGCAGYTFEGTLGIAARTVPPILIGSLSAWDSVPASMTTAVGLTPEVNGY
jgi:hypothetical protein